MPNYDVDDVGGKVTSGSASGNVVTLQLNSAAAATATLDYLNDNIWNSGEASSSLLFGANAIPALTFADVPIGPAIPAALSATAGNNQVALSWTASTGATSYNVQRSLTNGGPYAVIGTAVGASYTDSTATNGITYYYVISATLGAGQSGNSNQVSVTPVTAYVAWASNVAQGLTTGVNDGPLNDPDRDGIYNFMEFALSGAPMVSSQAVMPTLTKPAGSWLFEYDRSDAALASTTQVVEYGSDLTGWTPVTIPTTSAGIVTITPGSPSDHVAVAIPAGGNQKFVRLKVSQP